MEEGGGWGVRRGGRAAVVGDLMVGVSRLVGKGGESGAYEDVDMFAGGDGEVASWGPGEAVWCCGEEMERNVEEHGAESWDGCGGLAIRGRCVGRERHHGLGWQGS